MTVADALDLVSLVLLLLGAYLSLAAGIGLLRFRDVLSRMHAQTKPQIAGLMFMLVAIAMQQADAATILFLVPIMVFQMLTAPAAAAVLARGGYRGKHFDDAALHVDELAGEIEKAERLVAEERAEAEERAAAEERAEAEERAAAQARAAESPPAEDRDRGHWNPASDRTRPPAGGGPDK